MTTPHETKHITPEAREAVAVFLKSYNRAGRAISIWEALKAVRERYPVLEISDNDLTQAIAAQAVEADLNIDFDSTYAASHSSNAAELDEESSDSDEASGEVRAAISAFLSQGQHQGQPFAMTEALDAVRRIFPALETSDAELIDVIASEANAAGFDIKYDPSGSPRELQNKALDDWDNEGGANAPATQAETQRSIDADTSGARRRARETKERNGLI